MDNLRVINMMRTMKVDLPLNLEALHCEQGGKLFRGRPEMLLLRLSNGRNVQLFRRGMIQILGAIPEKEVEKMRHEILHRLRLITATPLMTSNMVVTTQIKDLSFRKITKSDKNVFYETELFPAALISKWYPAHVALFHNGKVVITGVKSLSHCHNILSSLIEYFK